MFISSPVHKFAVVEMFAVAMASEHLVPFKPIKFVIENDGVFLQKKIAIKELNALWSDAPEPACALVFDIRFAWLLFLNQPKIFQVVKAPDFSGEKAVVMRPSIVGDNLTAKTCRHCDNHRLGDFVAIEFCKSPTTRAVLADFAFPKVAEKVDALRAFEKVCHSRPAFWRIIFAVFMISSHEKGRISSSDSISTLWLRSRAQSVSAS